MAEPPATILHLELLEGPQAGARLRAAQEEGDRYQVGRTRSSKSFMIKDPAISEKHAEVAWRAGQWQLRDLGSSNGTTVNNEPLEEGGDAVALKTGDMVRFGTDTVARVTVEVVLDESLSVEQYLHAECTQLELQIKARAEALAQQLRREWQAAKQQLLAAGE